MNKQLILSFQMMSNTFKNQSQVIGLLLLSCLLSFCSQRSTDETPPPLQVNVAQPAVQQVTGWDEYTGRL